MHHKLTMTEEEKQQPLILKLRKLAGAIGEIENEFTDVCDSENYDLQVQTGLSTSIAEIFDYDI